jgi:hypothetical protein
LIKSGLFASWTRIFSYCINSSLIGRHGLIGGSRASRRLGQRLPDANAHFAQHGALAFVKVHAHGRRFKKQTGREKGRDCSGVIAFSDQS